MKTIILATCTVLIATLTANAEPSNFLRDKDEFRHGTYDRNWQPKTVYIDKDGSLLIPIGDTLVAADKSSIEKILNAYPGDDRKRLELRVYIHPEAQWQQTHDFIAWITEQNIGSLRLRLAALEDKKPTAPDLKSKAPDKP